MKKFLKDIRVRLVGAAIGLWFLFPIEFDRQEDPVRLPPVPAIDHADGSREHLLIFDGSDRKRGTEDDPHWVIKVPRGIQLEPLEEYIKNSQGRPPNKKFIYSRNLRISFYIDISQSGEVRIVEKNHLAWAMFLCLFIQYSKPIVVMKESLLAEKQCITPEISQQK